MLSGHCRSKFRESLLWTRSTSPPKLTAVSNIITLILEPTGLTYFSSVTRKNNEHLNYLDVALDQYSHYWLKFGIERDY